MYTHKKLAALVHSLPTYLRVKIFNFTKYLDLNNVLEPNVLILS